MSLQTPNDDQSDIPDISERMPRKGFGTQEFAQGAAALIAVGLIYWWMLSLEESGQPESSDEQLDLAVQTIDDQESQAVITSLKTSGFAERFEQNAEPEEEIDIAAILLDRGRLEEQEALRQERLALRKSAASAVSISVNASPRVADFAGSLSSILEEAQIDEEVASAQLRYANTAPGAARVDRNSGFLDLPTLRQASVRAGVLNDMQHLVLQGTLIDFVLETAIDSSLPGLIRGVTTQDVHSADGSRVLIPRFSRLIGEYRSGSVRGDARVFVIWTRLITQAGVDIALDSPGADGLGRSGLAGKVNTKFFQRFGGSILLSIIGGAAQEQSDNDNERYQYSESFREASSIALENSINIAPTINVKQATKGFVFVARDLDFSSRSVRARMAPKIVATTRDTEPSADDLARRMRRAEALDRRLRKAEADAAAAKIEAEISRDWEARCSYIALSKDRFLSTMVRQYLAKCGGELVEWNVSNAKDRSIDYRLSETMRVELPRYISSLQRYVLQGYSIRLTDLGGGQFAASQAFQKTQKLAIEDTSS